ncbi:lytic murein transglycosylase [uncultured Roseovarius sp.]|uniref:lytic murein transglycosylase n=1 Tax=uncultured Roseovarius sp. TaxID=293344 RepID=UPI0026182BBD|nr:lytic murein transglycosylase [uncultured Roseovarius sp.]
MRAVILGLTSVLLGLGTSLASAVEQSPRPQMRPGSGLITTAAVVSADLPVRSLRPQVRPDGLGDETVVLASTDPGFDRWVAGFKGRAVAQGINGRVFDRAFRGVRFDPEIVNKDRNQSEFKREIWDYLDSAVSPVRVENGQKALRRHRRALQRIEAHYGVEKEVVTAVWGMESTYGERLGDLPLIQSLATLAYDGRRGAFFEKQLVSALRILQSGDVTPENMKGSWAGAMGHTQFIPTSYEAYAVDFTGDGKRDIWSDNPTDALASTAAYLKRFGWTKGQPWGVEVRLPRGFSTRAAKATRMPSQWAAQGVVGLNGRAVPNHGRASVYLPAGLQGPAFMVFDNFGVIKRYNNSDAYAMGVGHLADRIGGGRDIQASWPRGYNPLSFDEKMEMQRRLRRKGFGVEKIDGIIGPNTINAIRAFQQSVGVRADGLPSQELLALLKRS